MFSASKLSETDKDTIHQWVADGSDMADVQKRLKSELGHSLTYMDTRFLALDLGLEFPSPEPEPEPEVEVPAEGSLLNPETRSAEFAVTVDQITRPGAIISGRVTFSDGEKALWTIDQMGRPALDSDTPGYRPSEDDLAKFQNALQDAIESGQA